MSDIEMKPCPYCNGKANLWIEDACFYYVCTNCNMRGPDIFVEKANAAEQVAEAWNALPRHLQWTTELPTEEGWYWWCGDTRCIPTIGRIGYQGSKADGLFTMPPLGTGVESVPISAVGGFWAGPIPEPQEVRK